MVILGRLRKEYLLATEYFAEILFTPQMRRNLSVRISFSKVIKEMGLTIVDDDRIPPREFTLKIRAGLSHTETLKTIAHEMIHVKQYAYNELNEEMTVWQGERINGESIKYADQPWEIEAYGIGDILYREFVKEYKEVINARR